MDAANLFPVLSCFVSVSTKEPSAFTNEITLCGLIPAMISFIFADESDWPTLVINSATCAKLFDSPFMVCVSAVISAVPFPRLSTICCSFANSDMVVSPSGSLSASANCFTFSGSPFSALDRLENPFALAVIVSGFKRSVASTIREIPLANCSAASVFEIDCARLIKAIMKLKTASDLSNVMLSSASCI